MQTIFGISKASKSLALKFGEAYKALEIVAKNLKRKLQIDSYKLQAKQYKFHTHKL